MTGKAVDCADIRSSFVAGSPPQGPEVDVHLRGCQACRELFERDAVVGRALAGAGAAAPDQTPGELLALVERDQAAEAGFRAGARALPVRVKVLGLLGLAGGLFLFHVVLRPRPDLGQYSVAVFWGVATSLCAALLVGSRAVASGLTAPLRARRIDALLAVALLAVPFVAALVAPLGEPSLEARGVWGTPAKCFGYGVGFAVPLVLLYWLFERREVIPLRVLVLAGGFAGVAANLLLHAHCPSVNVGHLLVGHASIGFGLAGLLALILSRRSRSGNARATST